MMIPAYTDIIGSYPQKADEIMLSASSLQQMEIDHPVIGMEIELRTILSEGAEDTALFSLSGYYTDYIDFSVTEPEAYVSKAFLEQQEIPVFPADKIMAVTGSLQDERGIETKLYSDLTMEYAAQQVSAENPMVKTKCGRLIRECLYCSWMLFRPFYRNCSCRGWGKVMSQDSIQCLWQEPESLCL